MGWQRETGRQAEGGLNPFSHSVRKRFREVNGASFLLGGKYPMCDVSQRRPEQLSATPFSQLISEIVFI